MCKWFNVKVYESIVGKIRYSYNVWSWLMACSNNVCSSRYGDFPALVLTVVTTLYDCDNKPRSSEESVFLVHLETRDLSTFPGRDDKACTSGWDVCPALVWLAVQGRGGVLAPKPFTSLGPECAILTCHTLPAHTRVADLLTDSYCLNLQRSRANYNTVLSNCNACYL